MAKSWREIYGDEDEALRPTITKRKWIKTPGRFWELAGGGGVPWEGAGKWEDYEESYYGQQEILDMMRRRFNRLPISYTTDPETGKVIASRSMPRFELPEELRGSSLDIQSLFKRPGEEDRGPLTFKWGLPEGALTGPKMISRHAPATDPMRQMGYQMGVSGLGTQRSMVNPQTFWPESRFKLPVGQPTRQGLSLPQFGGVMDYTSGRYRFQPPVPWREGRAIGPYQAEPGELYGAYNPYRPPGTRKKRRFWMGE